MIDRQITLNGKRYSKIIKPNGGATYRVQRLRQGRLFWSCLNPVCHRAAIERIEEALGGRT